MGHTLRREYIREEREREGNLKLECAHSRQANKVILNWQRPLREGDQEVVKRSDRDEPMWVLTHMYMEATLGISLYSYLYLKLAKTLHLSYYLLCFSLQQNWRTRGQNRFCLEAGEGGKGVVEGEVAQTMNKCKNNKKKIYGAQRNIYNIDGFTVFKLAINYLGIHRKKVELECS
jgi:hypothetical protein